MQIKLTLVCEYSARGTARGTAQGRDRPCFIKRDRPRFFEFLAKCKKNSRLVQTTLTLVCECSARGKAQGTAQGRDRPRFIKKGQTSFFRIKFSPQKRCFHRECKINSLK